MNANGKVTKGIMILKNIQVRKENKKMEKKSMGRRLSELRCQKEETQETVAESIGITVEYLSKIENDKKVPSMEVTKSFADYYDTTLDYIVYGRRKRGCNIIQVDEEIDEKTQEMLQGLVEHVVRIIKDCG